MTYQQAIDNLSYLGFDVKRRVGAGDEDYTIMGLEVHCPSIEYDDNVEKLKKILPDFRIITDPEHKYILLEKISLVQRIADLEIKHQETGRPTGMLPMAEVIKILKGLEL